MLRQNEQILIGIDRHHHIDGDTARSMVETSDFPQWPMKLVPGSRIGRNPSIQVMIVVAQLAENVTLEIIPTAVPILHSEMFRKRVQLSTVSGSLDEISLSPFVGTPVVISLG